MECPICFDNKWISKPPCGHFICLNCLIQLRKDECPSCRKPLWYSLPKEIQRIVTMRNNNHKNSNIRRFNINDYEEFPIL